MAELDYKLECLKINPNLKASKVSGTAFYHIIEGSKNAYKPYSDFKDTTFLAWKDCWFKIKPKESSVTREQADEYRKKFGDVVLRIKHLEDTNWKNKNKQEIERLNAECMMLKLKIDEYNSNRKLTYIGRRSL